MCQKDKEIERRNQLITRILSISYFFFIWLVAVIVGNLFVAFGHFKYRLIVITSIIIVLYLIQLFFTVTIRVYKRYVEDDLILFLPFNYRLFKLTDFIYSPKTQLEVFKPILSDWDDEYFLSLSKKEIWKARWINVRYTYSFILAMWQKSPIGDLIEFIKNVAK